MPLVDKLKPGLCLGLALLLSAHWSVAQKTLQLVSGQQIREGVAALPRIAAPNIAEAKINAALDRQDLWVRKAAEACSGPGMFWKRVVTVTKSGPALLSVLVSDSADCGGVHPFDETFPLVYDLRTGDAVRWDKVFPKGKAEEVSTSSSDGMPWITVRSKHLQALYVASYKGTRDCGIEIVAGETEFHLYPDENANGLKIFPAALPQVAHPCATAFTLRAKELQALGVSQQWQDAILRQYGKP
ncbi:hypothetical protein [Terriglobus albidus]|uniref:hypothetical protein n=1 Tax=Terriglobus albidus TaxID=1592106 RepID=UPI0021E048E9|nr:hypothetical protein [Terriglobus albidus]